MSDDDLALAVKAYLERHPHASRNELIKKLCTSNARLKKLHKAGVIEKLPAAMNASIAGTLNRRKNNLMAGWYINKPASWHGTSA